MPAEPPCNNFEGLFRQHWEAGTGKPKRKGHPPAWTMKEFADAMAKNQCLASEDAISNWVKGVNTPRRPQMLAIRNSFFPEPRDGSPQHPDWQRIYDAWSEATRPGARKERNAAPQEPPEEKASDWPRSNPRPFPGLAALELHTPRSDNQGGFYLHGRLDLAEREDDSTDVPIRLAMREAFLHVEVSENLVTDGSLIGKRAPHENLTPAGDALKIIGPKADTGSLDGEVFGETHIVTITPTDDAAAEVTVTVSVGRRAFEVTPLDKAGRPLATAMESEAKDAVLNALIFEKLSRDTTGRAVLQQAKLRRRAKE